MFEFLIVKPLYNLFVFLLAFIPGGDVGIAIILLTLLVRLAFFPAFSESIRTQIVMQKIQGQLNEIKKKYEKDAAERARRTMEVMRENKVRPFASIGTLIIQLVVFIGLYSVFLKEGLPALHTELLYSLTPLPSLVDIHFFGFLDLTARGIIPLAILVGGLQYLQGRLLFMRMQKSQAEAPSVEKQTPEELAAAMQQKIQKFMMLYLLPLMLLGFAYTFTAAAGIYFAANSVFSILQELYIARKLKA